MKYSLLYIASLLIILTVTFFTLNTAYACTDFRLNAKDGTALITLHCVSLSKIDFSEKGPVLKTPITRSAIY